MTTQIPELLDIEGTRWWFVVRPDICTHKRIVFNPLLNAFTSPDTSSHTSRESWLERLECHSRPEVLLRLRAFMDAHSSNSESQSELDQLIMSRDNMFWSTSSCRREYQGTWAIKGGSLFLTRLSLFKHWVLDGAEPLLATWVSGTFLAIPENSVDWPSYDEEQQRYRHFTIRKGRVIQDGELDGPTACKLKHQLLLESASAYFRRGRWDRMTYVAIAAVVASAIAIWWTR